MTPLAKDTLNARRVTVVTAGTTDASLPADLAPVADVRRVTIGSDHSGIAPEEGTRAVSARPRSGRVSMLARTQQIRSTIPTSRQRWPCQWRDVRRTRGSSSTAPGSDPRSPPTRSVASARRCVSTKRRPVFARAQRRERPGAGSVAAAWRRRRRSHRRRVARDGDARGALHQAPAEDSPAGRL